MNLKSFDASKSKFRSWVFSIAKNYMIDKWRCGSNTINCCQISLSNNNNFITSTNTNADNLIYYTTSNFKFENNDSINYISTQLSPQDFTLLDMKYMQGYIYCEIGKEFNVTSSTISNRINYIKTKLKNNNSEVIYD